MQERMPVVQKPFGDDDVEVYLHGYGRDWTPTDSTTCMLTPAGFYICQFALGKNIDRIFAPRTKFNAKFVPNDQLVQFGPMHRNQERRCAVFRGSPTMIADATSINHGEAFFVATNDDPTLILYHPEHELLCAHAGLKCLWDWQFHELGYDHREHLSVINSLVAQIPKDLINKYRAWICCGIQACHFHRRGDNHRCEINHFTKSVPTAVTESMLGEGCISIIDVIKSQLVKAGFEEENIKSDGIDTYKDMQDDGSPLWWSMERTRRENQTTFHHGNNGVLIIRR